MTSRPFTATQEYILRQTYQSKGKSTFKGEIHQAVKSLGRKGLLTYQESQGFLSKLYHVELTEAGWKEGERLCEGSSS